MLYIDEVLMLTVGIVLIVFIFLNQDRFKKIPQHKILYSSYVIILCAWFFTVIEGFIFSSIINLFEHICYMVSSFLFLYWVIKITQTQKA